MIAVLLFEDYLLVALLLFLLHAVVCVCLAGCVFCWLFECGIGCCVCSLIICLVLVY